MKDSGVNWIGKVPEHWDVARLATVATVVNGYPFDSQYFVEGDDGVPLIRIRDLFSTTTEVNYRGPIFNDAIVWQGDVIVGMDGAFNVARWRGKPALLNQRMCCIRTSQSALPGFIERAVEFPLKEIEEYTPSTTVKHLSSNQIRKLYVGVPPLAEQVAIARFLDHMDRRIEKHIRAKEKLIALLDEYKQALIHQAVTGQIDVRTGKPYPEYKESGTEWLGRVPKDWDIRPAKWHLREVDVRSKTGAEEMLSVSHITGVTPRKQKNVTMFKAESNVGHKLCNVGDIVVNTMWAWMAALGVARQEGLVSPSYAVYRPDGTALEGNYADLLLRTAPFKSEYIRRSTGIRESRLRLYPEDFLSIKLLCPSLEEQRAIVSFVDANSAAMRHVAGLARSEIACLREYRARIIADVVTGKLDVREVAATLPELYPLAGDDKAVRSFDTGNKPTLDLQNQPAGVAG